MQPTHIMVFGPFTHSSLFAEATRAALGDTQAEGGEACAVTCICTGQLHLQIWVQPAKDCRNQQDIRVTGFVIASGGLEGVGKLVQYCFESQKCLQPPG